MSDWRDELGRILDQHAVQQWKPVELLPQRDTQQRKENRRFISSVVEPAFEELAGALRQHGRRVDVGIADEDAEMAVWHDGELQVAFSVFEGAGMPWGMLLVKPLTSKAGFTEVIYPARRTDSDFSLRDVSQGDVIRFFVDNMEGLLNGDWHNTIESP